MNRDLVFPRLRSGLFGGTMQQSQVDGINTILDAWDASKFSDRRWLAYDLATTFHETGRTMQPVSEVGRGKGHLYGLPAGPWHNVYYGRGDVQETWETNYKKASARLAAHGIFVDLDRYPEKASDPKIASAILVYGMAEGWFTGTTLGHYFSPMVDDPVGARRIVNGTDRAPLIAGYHRAILPALKAA